MDSNLTEAYAALGWAVQHYDYDFVGAENAYRKAIALDSRNSAAHYRLGITLGFVGRFEEAVAEARFGFSLDPFSVPSASGVAWAHWFAREFDRMIAHCEKAVELHADLPQMHWALAWGHLNMSNFETAVVEMQRAAEVTRHHPTYLTLLAEVYAVAGRHDDAQSALATLLERSSHQYVSPYMLGRIYAGLGEEDQAFRWFERAYQQRAAWTPLLKRDPHLDRLHLDPPLRGFSGTDELSVLTRRGEVVAVARRSTGRIRPDDLLTALVTHSCYTRLRRSTDNAELRMAFRQ